MSRKIKSFSLVLSLILITVSVPMSVYSENTNQIENSEQITEIQEDFTITDELLDIQDDLDVVTQADELLEIEEPVDMATVSSDYEHVTGIPDGIYAIETAAISSYYILSSQSSAYASCNSISIPPTLMGLTTYLFTVTKVADTDRYIIRSMSDQTKTLCVSGDYVTWISISEDDSQVSESNTFNIIYANGTYRIKNVGTEKYICGNIGNLIASDSPETQVLPNWKFRGYRAYIEDGAYSFANLSNGSVWVSTQNDSYEAGAYIQQKTYDSCPIDSFSRGGMFKINRISNTDQYTIRLMTNNLLAWSFDGTSIVTENLPQNEADIPNSMRFYIAYDTGGYIIIPYGTMMAVSITDGVENLGTAYQISLPNTAKWNLYKYVGEPKQGIEILNSEDFISNGAIVGKTYNFNAVCWTTNVNFHTFFLALPSKCSDTATFNWNSSDYSGTLTVNSLCDMGLYIGLYGIKNGSTNIYITDSIDFRSILEEDVVYIQNKYSEKYATILGPSTDEGKIIHQYEYHEGTQIQWIIERDSYNPEYVLFKSLFSNKYMGVSPTNSNEIRQYSTIGDNTLWKIVELDNSSYKIINKAYENSGRVLATPSGASGNGQWLTQRAYVDDGDYSDEWNIVTQVLAYVNYYDSSVAGNTSIIENIDDAVSFANSVYARWFDLAMYMDGAATQYHTRADDCPLGGTSACTVEDCGENCYQSHHKNVDAMYDQLYNSDREDDHIYVLWTDRGYTYCEGKLGNHISTEQTLAFVRDYSPVIQFLVIYNDLSIELTEAFMSIVLVHETAHTFHMPDVYNNSDHNNKEGLCVMDKLSLDEYLILYQNITSKNQSPFCDSCMEKLLAYTSNINISGNQGGN